MSRRPTARHLHHRCLAFLSGAAPSQAQAHLPALQYLMLTVESITHGRIHGQSGPWLATGITAACSELGEATDAYRKLTCHNKGQNPRVLTTNKRLGRAP